MCLQAMTIVYGKCHEEIGAFNDTKYIVGMLERVSFVTWNICLLGKGVLPLEIIKKLKN
jgi:hypothetical protein